MVPSGRRDPQGDHEQGDGSVGSSKRRLLIAAAGLTAVLATAAVAGGTSGDQSKNVKRQIDGGRAKNVILLIGDGMGESEITLARNYAFGAGGRLPGIDAPPLTGDITTYSLQEGDPSKPNYVPDSAATGTAWATGHKTSNGRVNTAAGTDADLGPTLLQAAKKKGLGTGNVSTAEITDATPAVLFAHVTARGCQGPADMALVPQRRQAERRARLDRRAGHRRRLRRHPRRRPQRASRRPSRAARSPGRPSSSRPRRRATST